MTLGASQVRAGIGATGFSMCYGADCDSVRRVAQGLEMDGNV